MFLFRNKFVIIKGGNMSEKKKRMRVTESPFDQAEYIRNYNRENVYKIGYNAQRSTRTRERIAAAAALHGVTPAEYMRRTIEKQLTADGYPAPAEAAQAGR